MHGGENDKIDSYHLIEYGYAKTILLLLLLFPNYLTK